MIRARRGADAALAPKVTQALNFTRGISGALSRARAALMIDQIHKPK